jgi:hypothetical protein
MLGADGSQVQELAAWMEEWCVSAFLPGHAVAGRNSGDSIRLKNLLRDAENELIDLGVRRSAATELVSGVTPPDLGDRRSATFHEAGIASYVAPGLDGAHHFTCEAPTLVTVSRRFHLKPLLAELAREVRFFVLAVTRGSAQLYVNEPRGLQPVDVPEMPASLEEAVRYDDRERTLFSHSAARAGGGGVVAAFHGQGGRVDHLTEDMLRYLRSVDASLNGVVENGVPVVLAGSQDVIARYRQVSRRDNLADGEIRANPETLATTDLGAQARAIVDGGGAVSLQADKAQFEQLHGTGMASDVPGTVIEGARRGRLEVIFVAADTQWWGRFDADAAAPELHDFRVPGDEDLLDTAAVDAWRTGARIHVVPRDEVPGEPPFAGIFRY